MNMKIRVTIDLDKADKQCSETYGQATDYTGGAGFCDKDGIGYYWYGSPTYFAEFEDVEEV